MLLELEADGIHCWMDGEGLFKESQQRGFYLLLLIVIPSSSSSSPPSSPSPSFSSFCSFFVFYFFFSNIFFPLGITMDTTERYLSEKMRELRLLWKSQQIQAPSPPPPSVNSLDLGGYTSN